MPGYGFTINPMEYDEREKYIASLEHLRKLPQDVCLVCRCNLDSPDAGKHLHHVWPRAYGGTDLPEVALCNRHHTYVHKLATRLVSMLSKGQILPPTLKIETDGDPRIVLNLVKIIVTAYANPLSMDKRMHVILSGDTLLAFNALKGLFGCSDKVVIDRALQIAADVKTSGYTR